MNNKTHSSGIKKYKSLQIKLSKKLSGSFLGDFSSAFLGHGIEFTHLREYAPGDSVKKIDWKTTAKQNEPFIKNYEEQRDIHALFIFDTSSSMSFGSRKQTKLQTCEEVFFMLGSAASKSGFKISSLLGETYITPASGEKNIIRTLDILGNNKNSVGLSLDHNLLKNIKNQLVFIFTDKKQTQGLNALATYNDVIYINIFDSLELSGTDDSFITPLQNMMSIWTKKKNADYTQARESSLQTFKNTLRKKRIRYLAVDDMHDMMLSFYKFFNQKI